MSTDETNNTTPGSQCGSQFVDVLFAIATIVGSMGLSFLAAIVLYKGLIRIGSDEPLAAQLATSLGLLGNVTVIAYFPFLIPFTTGRFVQTQHPSRHRLGMRVGAILICSFLAFGCVENILNGNVQGDVPTKFAGLSVVALWVIVVGWDLGRRAAEIQWKKRSDLNAETL